MTPSQVKLIELSACMFGTLVLRDPSDCVNRPKHDTDGWRHGCSRTFELDGKVFGGDIDNMLTEKNGTDLVTAMYQRLHGELTERADAELEALPPTERAAQDDAPKPNACCNVADNLVRRPDLERPDLSVNVCRVCRCRHFELTVDPTKIISRGANVS